MKILHPINFDTFNRSSVQAIDRFHEMPPPLPWIEPGINMIYLEAVSSYVYGNDLGAILLTGGLLEHVLSSKYNVLRIYSKRITPIILKAWIINLLTEDIDYIGTRIDNFASLEILDGKKAWVKHPETKQKVSVDYYVNEDNCILVDCYRRANAEPGSLNADDYTIVSYLHEIIPASEQSKGYADIKVYGSSWDYDDNGDQVYYDEEMTILYTIEIIQ